MREKLERLFCNPIPMVVSALVACVLLIAAAHFLGHDHSMLQYSVGYVLLGTLILGLLASCKAREPSCQKTLLGAILFYLMYTTVSIAVQCFVYDMPALYTARCVLMAVLYLFVFGNHVAIQADHVGNRLPATVNQAALFLMILVEIIALVAVRHEEGTMISDYCFNYAILATNVMVVCVETKIQAYKRIRAEKKANGTWDDEAREKGREFFSF